jgi:excisionase family DNA binding protein
VNDPNIYRMLTVDEAADVLGVSERTVRNMVADERLPSWRPSPGTIRIPYWLLVQLVNAANSGFLPSQSGEGFVTRFVTVEGSDK